MADPVVYTINDREYRPDGTPTDGEGTAGVFSAAVLIASVHNVGGVNVAPLSPGELAVAAADEMEKAYDPEADPIQNERALQAAMAKVQVAHRDRQAAEQPEGVLTAEASSPTAPSVPPSAPAPETAQAPAGRRRASQE